MYDDILKKRRDNLYYLMENFRKFSPWLVTMKKEPHEEIGPSPAYNNPGAGLIQLCPAG